MINFQFSVFISLFLASSFLFFTPTHIYAQAPQLNAIQNINKATLPEDVVRDLPTEKTSIFSSVLSSLGNWVGSFLKDSKQIFNFSIRHELQSKAMVPPEVASPEAILKDKSVYGADKPIIEDVKLENSDDYAKFDENLTYPDGVDPITNPQTRQ